MRSQFLNSPVIAAEPGKQYEKGTKMNSAYVHGYDLRENIRLQDQASTLIELLHSDTIYPAGSTVLEAGCGVGAQTVTLAGNSPEALITSVDISEDSVATANEHYENLLADYYSWMSGEFGSRVEASLQFFSSCISVSILDKKWKELL